MLQKNHCGAEGITLPTEGLPFWLLRCMVCLRECVALHRPSPFSRSWRRVLASADGVTEKCPYDSKRSDPGSPIADT